MKRRIRKIVNFFAFNLLFFALYLNFIHKDNSVVQPVLVQPNAAAYNGTVPVQNPEKYLSTKTAAVVEQQTTESKGDNTALKLSIN